MSWVSQIAVSVTLVASIVLPLVFTLLITNAASDKEKTGSVSWQNWLPVIAPIPAVLLALYAPPVTAQIPGILLGVDLVLNDITRAFLAITALLWTLAALMTRKSLAKDKHRARYLRVWLLTLTGNLGLIVAVDVASFYLMFALMTFAAWGMVIHNQTEEALKAGKVYIVLAVIGEVILLAGLLMGSAAETTAGSVPLMTSLPGAIAESEQGLLIAGLLFVGFGVKAGVAGLHWWLPLAHPVAPTPASAVLSGAMIKAGLLGMITVLPLGDFPLVSNNYAYMALAVIALGLTGAFGAAVVSLFSTKAKTVLAWSSISQMGLMVTLVGVAWQHPVSWPLMGAIVTVYAVHHGLAKGALFFGTGMAHQPGVLSRFTVLALLLIPALILAGAPLTSGAAAKYMMKDLLYELPAGTVTTLLTYSAVATSVLMARFLWLVAGEYGQKSKPESARSTSPGKLFHAMVSNPLMLVPIAAIAFSVIGLWLMPLPMVTAFSPLLTASPVIEARSGLCCSLLWWHLLL